MGRSRSPSRSPRDRRRRSRSRDKRRDRSRSKDRDRDSRRRHERRRSRSRSESKGRRRSRSAERRRNRSRSKDRDGGRSRDRSKSPSRGASQSAAMPSASSDDKRQQRLAKLAAWKQQQGSQIGGTSSQPAASSIPVTDSSAANVATQGWYSAAAVPAPTQPVVPQAAWQPPPQTASVPSASAPPAAAPPRPLPPAAPAEGLLGEEGDDVDPLDAFMAAEVLPEVKAKEAEEKKKQEEERRLLHDLIQKGKVPKILEVDSDDEEPEADVEIQIPFHKVKLVVGAGGEKIKWIQRKSKCRIQVKKDEKELSKAFGSGPTFNIPARGPQKEGDQVKMATLQLFGSAEQCNQARAMIEEAVDNREQKQKQRHKEYEKKKDAKWRDRQIYYMRHAHDYEVLGLPLGASKANIKQAFRKMALKWHPDKNQDRLEEAEKMFQEISRAYENLMTTDEDARIEQIGL